MSHASENTKSNHSQIQTDGQNSQLTDCAVSSHQNVSERTNSTEVVTSPAEGATESAAARKTPPTEISSFWRTLREELQTKSAFLNTMLPSLKEGAEGMKSGTKSTWLAETVGDYPPASNIGELYAKSVYYGQRSESVLVEELTILRDVEFFAPTFMTEYCLIAAQNRDLLQRCHDHVQSIITVLQSIHLPFWYKFVFLTKPFCERYFGNGSFDDVGLFLKSMLRSILLTRPHVLLQDGTILLPRPNGI